METLINNTTLAELRLLEKAHENPTSRLEAFALQGIKLEIRKREQAIPAGAC